MHRVRHTGAGISPENIKQLFSNIVQFDAAKLQAGGGSGIGLFLSKGIMDLHGGRIGARSAGVGHGAIFHIDIPVYSAAADSRPRNSSVTSAASAASSHLRASAPGIFYEWVVSDADPGADLCADTAADAERIEEPETPPIHFGDDEDGAISPGHSALRSLFAPTPMSANYSLTDISVLREAEERTVAISDDKPPVRVLVVDDSAATRKMIIRFLKMTASKTRRFVATEAVNGAEAVRIIAAEQPSSFDIVLVSC
jgi:hypothetical protein